MDEDKDRLTQRGNDKWNVSLFTIYSSKFYQVNSCNPVEINSKMKGNRPTCINQARSGIRRRNRIEMSRYVRDRFQKASSLPLIPAESLNICSTCFRFLAT